MVKYTRLWPVFFGLVITGILALGLLRNSGVFLARELTTYREQAGQIQIDADEAIVRQHFKRVHPQQSQFIIGLIAVEDHQPVFAGRAYRVYAIGYYDADHYPRRLMHIICQDGKVIRTVHGRVDV